jgi:dimethylhistidine N-methyltransferase
MTLQFSSAEVEEKRTDGPRLIRRHRPRSRLIDDALVGLSETPKTLPCKYFYDARGSELFEKITRLPEYYPTRTELGIMQSHVDEMAAELGPNVQLVEFGSGSGEKTASLVAALDRPASCVLVDISETALKESMERLADRFSEVELIGVCADYTSALELPAPTRAPRRTAAYFPGSTIGNFSRDEARGFLERVARLVGPGGALLIGFDRVKDVSLLENAYNDQQGVTADFNLNLLHQLESAGAVFDIDAFEHEARYNRGEDRIEMHLVSQREQAIHLADRAFKLAEGETICTEHSHKYRLEDFAELAGQAGWRMKRSWSDEKDWFSICYLTVPPSTSAHPE